MRGTLVVVVALTLLAVPSGVAIQGDTSQEAEPEVSTEADCAPPCGEINPRLMVEFPDLSDETVPLEKGESKTFEGTLTFWADTDDEGYSPRDPSEPITVSFSFPRLPAWAEMSVEPTQIEVPVNTCAQCFKVNTDDPSRPAVHWAFSAPVEMTVTAVDTPETTPGYDYGKLQLFAKSSESGIYNPGYGIREVRVTAAGGDTLEQTSTDESTVPGPGGLAAVAALGAVSAMLALRRER